MQDLKHSIKEDWFNKRKLKIRFLIFALSLSCKNFTLAVYKVTATKTRNIKLVNKDQPYFIALYIVYCPPAWSTINQIARLD